MDQVATLCVLSLAMFLGCYLSGLIPLVLTLSERLLRNVTVFGAGLLIGTALIVIIPEGIESLYNSGDGNNSPMDPGEPEIPQPLLAKHPNGEMRLTTNTPDTGDEPQGNQEIYLGLSLVMGFVFMLLIDQLSPSHTHTNNESNIPNTDSELAVRRGGGGAGGGAGLTATIGLVVHAAADGLALGAAAGLSKTNVEFIIFIAIMLHKAPAAFGFTSFLIHEGLDKKTAKCHLFIFASAAPLASFVAYFGLVRVLYSTQIPVTGVTMLFSAGTFLYVATVHVLNEVTASSTDSNKKLTKPEVAIITTGALLPLLFNLIHSH